MSVRDLEKFAHRIINDRQNGRKHFKPIWWPSDVTYPLNRGDLGVDEWKDLLLRIIICCYKCPAAADVDCFKAKSEQSHFQADETLVKTDSSTYRQS